MTTNSTEILLSISKMNRSVIVLVALSIILVRAKAYDYPQVDSFSGLPSHRKRYDHHEQPSGDYRSNARQEFHRNSDRKKIQDEYTEAVGPVHTFVKTDEHAHFKWGVRHHIG